MLLRGARWARYGLCATRAVVGLWGLVWAVAGGVTPSARSTLVITAAALFAWLLVDLSSSMGTKKLPFRPWHPVLDCVLLGPLLICTQMRLIPSVAALCVFSLIWAFSRSRAIRISALASAAAVGVLAATVAMCPSREVVTRGFVLPCIAGLVGWQWGRALDAHGSRWRLTERVQALRQAVGDQTSALQEMRERVVQTERLAAVGQLAFQIAHQVRNPLTSLSLNTELLGDDVRTLPEPSRSRAFALVQSITTELDLLVDLTEGYLHFGKLPTVERRPGLLNRVVKDLLGLLQAEISRDRIELRLQLDPADPLIPMDPRQLRFAFVNLIKNSIESMPGGGRLHIRTVCSNEHVDVQIADTGYGIPLSDRDRIFDMLYTTKERGTGLGLSFVKRIVDAHQGAVLCESTAGVGTMFTVRLPRESELDHGNGSSETNTHS